MRRTEKKFIANLQRSLLIFRAATVRADGNIARAVGPGDLQVFYVIAGDLVQRHKARCARGVAIVGPVFLLFTGLNRGERKLFARCRHRIVRNKHAPNGGGKGNRQQGRKCPCAFPARELTGAAQQRGQGERHQNGNAREGEQTGDQRPEVEADIPQGPEGGARQHHKIEGRATQALTHNLHTRDDEQAAADQKVGATLNADQLPTVVSEEYPHRQNEDAQKPQQYRCGSG